MLSRFDDYPIHQTPEPIAVAASSDRNVYDRYWFNGYAGDGEFYFGVGMALYPNRGILDGAFTITRDGVQHAFHGSRRASGDPSDTRIGPYRIEVVEPMRATRVVLEPNETGIECDLTFRARSACIDEGRQIMRDHLDRVTMDSTRFCQFGHWSGSIVAGGETLRVDRCYGTKDRSWGIRPVGEPQAGGAPAQAPTGIFFLWAPIHWEDQCTHWGTFEYADGHPWHTLGGIVPAYTDPASIPGTEDPACDEVVRGEHEIVYEKGTRRAESVKLTLHTRKGDRRVIELEPILTSRMKGLGYTHLARGHGRWQGELSIHGESWKTSELDPLALDNQHIQQVMRARMGDREGVGVMEQLCFGPYEPYGFKELLDGAA